MPDIRSLIKGLSRSEPALEAKVASLGAKEKEDLVKESFERWLKNYPEKAKQIEPWTAEMRKVDPNYKPWLDKSFLDPTRPDHDTLYQYIDDIKTSTSQPTKSLKSLGAIGAGAAIGSLSSGKAQASEKSEIDLPDIYQDIKSDQDKVVEQGKAFKQEMKNISPEQKSKIMDFLDAYETAGRSALSTASFGISESLFGGLNALITNLVDAGFNSKDAVDFVKRSVNPEQFKKGIKEDIERREKMKKEYPKADVVGSLAGAFSPRGPSAFLSGKIPKVIPGLEKVKKIEGVAGIPAKAAAHAVESAVTLPAITGIEHAVGEATGYSDKEFSPQEEAKMGALLGGGIGALGQTAKVLGKKGVAAAALPFLPVFDFSKEPPSDIEETPISPENEARWKRLKESFE